MRTLRKDKLLATERPPHFYRYVVEGRGPFPVDMLRYDCAWPYSQESVNYFDADGKRMVEVASYREPNAERWSSFGWRIV
jgi:hypothetical protein